MSLSFDTNDQWIRWLFKNQPFSVCIFGVVISSSWCLSYDTPCAYHLQIIFRMRLKPEVLSRMTWWGVKTNTKQQKPFTDLAFTCLPDLAMLDGMCVKNTNDLKWNTHIRNVCTKVNRTLRFLRRTLFPPPRRERSSLIIRVWCDQYGSSVWDPRCVGLNEE